jgi:hypothetical protein
MPFITFHKVLVNNYDDAEFADLLRLHHVNPIELPPRLNRFMRNPRICSLALTMRTQLANVEDLSVDRLLIEYWRARLFERGDLVGHDDVDFHNLLMQHAREYRARPGTNFRRDEWRSRSGAATRDDGRNLANDLSDIEEGRFFDTARGIYSFREETLHFALGLLLADEIRATAQASSANANESFSAAIDPMRGFDAAVDVVTSALAIATLDGEYPDNGIVELMSGWLSLQNVTDDAFDELIPYVAARPEPFLDAFEQRDLNNDDGRFLQLLLSISKRESVAEAVRSRLSRWLGTWTRALPDWSNHEERRRQVDAQNARIDQHLGQLTESERSYVQQHCIELPSAAGLADAGAILLRDTAQTPFSTGIVAFALAHTIAGTSHSPLDDVAWAIRLNRIDFEEVCQAVKTELAPFMIETASITARESAARALRLLASVEAQRDAEALDPASYSVKRDPPINLLDPATEPTPEIADAVATIGRIDLSELWRHMSSTGEDHDLERNFVALLRFEPDVVMAFLDRAALTVSSRTAMPLRQIGWRLPWLSPIVGKDAVEAIRRRVQEVSADPTLAPNGDEDFVVGMLTEAAMPRLDAEAQLDLLQSLPSHAPFYMRYFALAKPLSINVIDRRLGDALNSDPRVLERTLLFLSANADEVSDGLRQKLITCLRAENIEVRAAAANFARYCRDAGLDEAVLDLEPPDVNDRSWRAAVIRSAVASAIGRLGRPELIDRIPIEHIDWVAARMPAARERLADVLASTIERFTRPIATEEPSDAVVVLEINDDPAATRINLVDRGVKDEDPISAFNAEMSDTTGAAFRSRRQMLAEQLDRFLSSLTNEGALMVAKRPYSIGLEEVARAYPERYAGWLRTIIEVQDERALRNLQNLGFALAQNYAAIDGDLAARTFVHLWRIEPHVTVQIGPAKHSIRDLALFAAAASPEIDNLRRRAFEDAEDDERIERLVTAAEAADAADWLDTFIEVRASSRLVADQALALTAASFRQENFQSDELLGRDWLTGFLGNAARDGQTRYNTAKHAAHWFELTASANDPREQWRFLELGIAAADRRQFLKTDPRLLALIREIGGDVPQRLRKSVEKASKANGKTLYGMRKPRTVGA